MTPYRAAVGHHPLHALWVAVAAAVGGAWEHYLGLIDPLLIVVVGLWTLDMFGGTLRAMVVAARDEVEEWEELVESGMERRESPRVLKAALTAVRWTKAGEGLLKLLCVGLWVAVGGAAELNVGLAIPLVGMGLFVAMLAFSASILDQVTYFWPELGERLQTVFDRAMEKRDPDQEAS